MAKRHLITDWDGVLGDTPDMNYGIVTALHPEVTRDDYLIRHHLGNVLEEPVVPFTDESAAAYYRHYNERLSRAHVERALPAISALAEKFIIHVVTSNCEHAIRRVLREAGVEQHFGLMLGQEAHTSKVEKFKRLFAEEGFSAHETLYLTDTAGDIKEAKKVGLRTLAVTFGYHPRKLLAEHEPTALADTWDEVLAHVEQLLPSRAQV